MKVLDIETNTIHDLISIDYDVKNDSHPVVMYNENYRYTGNFFDKVKFFQDSDTHQKLTKVIESCGHENHTGKTVVCSDELAERVIEFFNELIKQK
jgi:hypothetical protein